jgi:septum formation protein
MGARPRPCILFENLKEIRFWSVMEKERERQASDATGGPENLIGEKLLLASASPRRAEILRAVGWPFETCPVNIDESPRASENPVAYVERLAREKAEAAAVRHATGLVLGADTIVVAGGDMLGKPRDEQDARRMLRSLSDRWHDVLTGVALLRAGESGEAAVAHETTRVRFSAISDAEIDWYVATGEPLDKAGAYAAQGRAALFIEGIDGDYWNVVGLPVRLVYRLAREMIR